MGTCKDNLVFETFPENLLEFSVLIRRENDLSKHSKPSSHRRGTGPPRDTRG